MKFLTRLLGVFGGKKKKKKRATGKGTVLAKSPRKPVSKPAPTSALSALPIEPAASQAPPNATGMPVASEPASLDAFIDLIEVTPVQPREEVLQAPVVLEALVPVAAEDDPLAVALRAGDVARVESLVAGARSLSRSAQAKQRMFASYEAQLARAIGVRDFMTLSFVGSSLIIDAAYFRDELLALAKRLNDFADRAQEDPRNAGSTAGGFSEQLVAFNAQVAKKTAMLATLDAKIIKAHQARDFGMLSDLTSALSRDAMILASLQDTAVSLEASDHTGLTATSSNEKAAQIDQQVAQLHQAILDRAYPSIADIARIVSLNSGVLADPSTTKAAQILQLGQQLQGAMKASRENPATAALCGNLSKIASVFNGPLMDKANQLEGQVGQLQAALKSLDQNKMFTLSVTIARSAAILTDATVQKASLLAGYVPRIDSSLKRKDFSGASTALKNALS